MMHFDIWPAPPDLAPFVLGFAERRDGEALGRALELPFASPLLQFILRGRYCVQRLSSSDGFERAPDAALWGSSGSAVLGRHTEPLHVFVVILTNKGAASFARLRPSEITDRRLALDALWPTETFLIDQLASAGSFAARVSAVSVWLRELSRPVYSKDWPILDLADQIASGRVRGTVGPIAASAGIDASTLRRTFERVIGRTPKASLRLARLQRALVQIHPQPWRNAAEEDALLEYFDQSHFMKDFVQLATVRPRQYLLAKRQVGDPLVNTIYGL